MQLQLSSLANIVIRLKKKQPRLTLKKGSFNSGSMWKLKKKNILTNKRTTNCYVR